MAIAMVLAVNWPPHAPAPGQATASSSFSSSSVILPAACAPTAFVDVLDGDVDALELPGHDRAAVEHDRRECRAAASAIAAPGMVLSQPTSVIIASNK